MTAEAYNRLPEVGELYEIRGTDLPNSKESIRVFWLIINVEHWTKGRESEEYCRVTFLDDAEQICSFSGCLQAEIHFWSKNFIER